MFAEHGKDGFLSCKPNASQRCREAIFEIAKMWEDAPNASTCQHEDPNYEMVMALKRNCTQIP